MALVQYRYFGDEHELSNVNDINNLNSELIALIGQNIIKHIKIQSLPNTRVYLEGSYFNKINQNEEEITEIDSAIEIDEEKTDNIMENIEIVNDTTEKTKEQTNRSINNYLLIGGTGILDLDLFSWTTQFTLTKFQIELPSSIDNNLFQQYGTIVNIEYYSAEQFKDPYSEIWINYDKIVEETDK